MHAGLQKEFSSGTKFSEKLFLTYAMCKHSCICVYIYMLYIFTYAHVLYICVYMQICMRNNKIPDSELGEWLNW